MADVSETNILEQDPPENHLERVRFLAKALAYGARQGIWTPRIRIVTRPHDGYELWHSVGGEAYSTQLNIYLRDVWNNHRPNSSFLFAEGYFDKFEGAETKHIEYILSDKARTLLEEPAVPPTVFISYRRDESSALGLLVVARLQARGVQNPFIDMQIELGEEWHAKLEKRVQEAKYFIALIAPTTLESEFVRREIRWALDQRQKVGSEYQIIPVLHRGFNRQYSDSLAELGRIQHVEINVENAANYDAAMVQLLNKLGYAPR